MNIRRPSHFVKLLGSSHFHSGDMELMKYRDFFLCLLLLVVIPKVRMTPSISFHIKVLEYSFKWTRNIELVVSGLGSNRETTLDNHSKDTDILLKLVQVLQTTMISITDSDKIWKNDLLLKQDKVVQPVWLIICNDRATLELELDKVLNLIAIARPDLWNPMIIFIVPETVLNDTTILPRSNFSIASDVYISSLKNRTQVSVWEIYSIGNKIILQDIVLGTNGRVSSSILRNTSTKISRRRNFQGMVIRATAFNDSHIYPEEANFKSVNSSDALEFGTGMAVSMIKYLAQSLNFTIQAQPGIWSEHGNNSLETEFQLVNGLTDIVISHLVETKERKSIMTFLQPTYSDRMNAYFVTPTPTSVRDIFATSFKWDLWISLISAWFVIAISLLVIVSIKDKTSDHYEEDFAIADESFIWKIGAICQQGWHIEPKSASVRIIFIIGYFLAVVCLTAFSAAIVSTLSVQFKVINSFSDLIQNSFRLFGANDESITWDHMKLLLQGMGLDDNEMDSIVQIGEVDLTTLTTSKSALIGTPDTFKTELSYNLPDSYICRTFSSVPAQYNLARYSMMIPKHSSFEEYFNWGILAMMENGLIHRYGIHYQNAMNIRCLKSDQSSIVSLGAHDIFTAYLILLIGYFLAVLCLCFEKIQPFVSCITFKIVNTLVESYSQILTLIKRMKY